MKHNWPANFFVIFLIAVFSNLFAQQKDVHPNLVITKKDVSKIKAELGKVPLFDKTFNAAKKEIDLEKWKAVERRKIEDKYWEEVKKSPAYQHSLEILGAAESRRKMFQYSQENLIGVKTLGLPIAFEKPDPFRFDKEQKKLHNDMMDTASEFGNALQNAFARSGKSLINYLNVALQSAIRIMDIMDKMNTGEKSNTSGVLGIISSILPFFAMANGGIINEPVFGVGKMTGRSYAFGEGGVSEMVMPMNRILPAYSGGQNINVHVTVDGRTKGTDIEYVVRQVQKRIGKFN